MRGRLWWANTEDSGKPVSQRCTGKLRKMSSLQEGLLNEHEAGGREDFKYREMQSFETNAMKQKETKFI